MDLHDDRQMRADLDLRDERDDSPPPRAMPDIAKRAPDRASGRLDRVGMAHVEMPVQLLDDAGRLRMLPAICDAFVSLDDPHAKGIHMSRLFLALQETLENETLSTETLGRVLDRFLASHAGLSGSAHVAVRFDWMEKRKALSSDHAGWRTYPIELFATRTATRTMVGMKVRVTYSSTCPCSAALARHLIQEQFDADFGGQSRVEFERVRAWLGTPEAIRATPHSQRSHADVTVHVDPARPRFDFGALLSAVEGALKTVVQAAVKREDEQAFALLNGQNLMFCEDAARVVRAALEAEPAVRDYHIRASHYESLHPHDAVAIVVKGVPGGLTA